MVGEVGAGEAQHLEAEEVVEGVVVEVLVVLVQVGGEEVVEWLLIGVAQEGELMPSDQMRGLPQMEVVCECLCCHLGERVGLMKRYSAFWV